MKSSFATSKIILARQKLIDLSQKSLDDNLNNVYYFQDLLNEQIEDLECFKKCLSEDK